MLIVGYVLSFATVSTRQKKSIKGRRLLFPILCLLLGAYFLHHSLNGRLGYYSQQSAADEALHLEYQLAALKQRKIKLHTRVKLIRNGSIEKDMLDEQARYHLNLLQVDEIAIMH